MNEIHFAPLQGFTDFTYRKAHFHYIGDIDYYYTPYFSVDDSFNLNPENYAEGLFDITIPQVLPGNLDELKVLFRFINEKQFSAINFNLGCPYPMVTRKGRGAALIQNPDLVSEMIQFVSDHSNLKISLKTRLGLLDDTGIFNLLNKIEPGKVETVIIHPRTAKQLYKGEASQEKFIQCKELFPEFDLIYNGDINTFEDYNALKVKIPGQQKWMIGRGLLSNPLLGSQIKNNSRNLAHSFYGRLQEFANHLIEYIESDSNNKGHALNRVKSQFVYLSRSFPDQKRIFRIVRKSKSVFELKQILSKEILNGTAEV